MEIATDRLIMREFRPEDWQAVLAYQRDPLYLRYYAWTGRSAEEVQRFVRMFVDDQKADPRTRFQLAVELKASGELIGNCGIRLEKPGGLAADIGYEIAPGYWGNGYATEAARAMLAFGMESLKLHRVWASCVADNLGSARVLLKLGMRLEARLREAEFYKDRYWDSLIFAILEEEWGARQGDIRSIF